MDTMVLLVGGSRRDEEDDCACSHNLTGVRRHIQVKDLRLHAGGNALKTITVNFRFQFNFHLDGESKGENV
jgi:hypothetical protein